MSFVFTSTFIVKFKSSGNFIIQIFIFTLVLLFIFYIHILYKILMIIILEWTHIIFYPKNK